MNAIPNPLTTCICLAYVYDQVRVLLHALARSADEDSSRCFHDYDAKVVIGITQRSLSGADRTNPLCLQHESPDRLLLGNAHTNIFAPSRSPQPAFTILLVVYYYGYRYYKPGLGRWLSEDPLLDPGSVPVMEIRKYVLQLLEEQLIQSLYSLLDENLSDEERIDALNSALKTSQTTLSVSGNRPDIWLSLAGENWTMFCANNPMLFVDPWGLQTNDPCAEREPLWYEDRNRWNILAGAIGIIAGAEIMGVGAGIAIVGGPPGIVAGGIIGGSGAVLFWAGIRLVRTASDSPAVDSASPNDAH